MNVWIDLREGEKSIKRLQEPLNFTPPLVRFNDDVFVWSGFDREKNLTIYRKTSVYEVY